jgi:ornithine--oxo-acid transaminase
MATQFIEQPLHTQDFVELENRYGAHNYHPLDVVIERAEGVWVYDVEGKRYLDCLAAYSAVNQGHCHPKILQTSRGASPESYFNVASISQRAAPSAL